MVNSSPWLNIPRRIFECIENYPIYMYGILLSDSTKNLAIADNSTGGWTVLLKVYFYSLNFKVLNYELHA